MTTPAALAVRDWPLPYVERLESRAVGAIDLVVVHCTELPDLATARIHGERILYPASGTGNSGHWYIDRDGATFRFVEPSRIAHHVHGCNARSIGIELVNRGRWPDWNDSRRQEFTEPYPPAQIEALIALLHGLRATLPKLQWIAAHEDLDRRREPASDDASILLPRRRDPGPLFPWPKVLARCRLPRLVPDPGAA